MNKACQSLPFGCPILFDAEEPQRQDQEPKKNRLLRCFGEDKEQWPNRHDSEESLFAQYMVLAAFPSARFAYSNFHAGQGRECGVVCCCSTFFSLSLSLSLFLELSFGSSYRRKADLTVSVEEDEIETDGGREEQVSPGHWVRHPPQPIRQNKRTFLHYMNFDGSYFHRDGKHLPDCPKRPDDDDEVPCTSAAAAAAVKASSPEDISKRNDDHATKVGYALALSNVDPDHLVITWTAVHECDFFHRGTIPSVSLFNRHTSGAKVRASQRRKKEGGGGGGSVADPNIAKADAYIYYKSVREYLAVEHPVDSLLGTNYKSFTQESLVNLILSKPHNSVSEESDFGGFVLITGGREGDAQDGVDKRSFAFAHQRCSLDAEKDVGSFTKYQSLLMHGGDREKAKETISLLAAVPGTMTKTSIHNDDGGELWSLDFLRWMISERAFHGFKIRHFILFKNKHYLTPFIKSLLQRRWDLRRENDPAATALLSQLLKLLGNGECMIGYDMISLFLSLSLSLSPCRPVWILRVRSV